MKFYIILIQTKIAHNFYSKRYKNKLKMKQTYFQSKRLEMINIMLFNKKMKKDSQKIISKI